MNTAIYDLTKYPTTFDISPWLVIAKTNGCDHVHFIIDGPIAHWKYPEEVAWRRFGNILVPHVKMAGMTFSVGERRDGPQFPYHPGDVERTFQQFGTIAKLAATQAPESTGYVTITMRESFRNTHRDSDKDAWNRVARYLSQRGEKIVILPECEHAPLDLEYRMAVYAGAKMNLGASGGPVWMCAYSDYPYLIFNLIPKRQPTEPTYDMVEHMNRGGFGPGSQFSFRTDQQQMIWEPDDYENIIRAYETMSARCAGLPPGIARTRGSTGTVPGGYQNRAARRRRSA